MVIDYDDKGWEHLWKNHEQFDASSGKLKCRFCDNVAHICYFDDFIVCPECAQKIGTEFIKDVREAEIKLGIHVKNRHEMLKSDLISKRVKDGTPAHVNS